MCLRSGRSDRLTPFGRYVLQDGDSDAQRRYDYLGGDLYASFSAALNFPLPFEPLTKAGIRGHAFVNAGGRLGVASTCLRTDA